MTVSRRALLAGAALGLSPRVGRAEPADELLALSNRVNLYSREQRLLHARLSFEGLARVDVNTQRLTDARFRTSGRLLLVHLWSVSCTPCVTEMPTLRQIMSHLGKQSGPALRSHFIAEDLPGPLTEYLREHGGTLPAVEHWVSGPSSNLRVELHDAGQPLTLLLDGSAVVRHAFVGPLTERRNELYSTVSRLLRCLSPGAR